MPAPSRHDEVLAVWLGTSAYADCLALQRALLAMRVENHVPDVVLLTEHLPVYTFGTSSNRNHLLDDEALLHARGIDVCAVERGGDVTFHGPGQLVVYPLLDLHGYFLDLHRYLRSLEETVIRLVRRYGILAGRHHAYTGVWVGDDKLCAIGVHTSRWCTMHGLALNNTVDLAPFDRMIPCGIREKGVTSLSRLGVPPRSTASLVDPWLEEFGGVFERSTTRVDPSFLASLVGEAGGDILTAGVGSGQTNGLLESTHERLHGIDH